MPHWVARDDAHLELGNVFAMLASLTAKSRESADATIEVLAAHLVERGLLDPANLERGRRMAAVAARLNPDAISDSHAGEPQRPALRPPYSVLGSERGPALPSLDESLLKFVRDRAVVGTAA